MRIHYLTYYRLAFEQFREAGAKICVWIIFWMGLGCFSPFLLFNYTYHEYLKLMLGISESIATPVIGQGASFLLSVAFISVMIYSMMGVVQQTGDDSDANWLTCGIQGVLHPLRAIRVSVVLIIVSLLYAVLVGFCSLGMAFIIPFAGPILAMLFVLAAYAVYIYASTGIGYAWFLMLDDSEMTGTAAIRGSIDEIRGRRMPILGLLLPVLIASVLLGIGMGATYYKYISPRVTEGELAVETYHQAMQNRRDMAFYQNADKFMALESDKKYYRHVVENEFYSPQVPEYETFDGSFGEFVSALAQYGADREEFLAIREHREVLPLVRSYREHPAGSKRWGVLSLLCALGECLLAAVALVLLFKVYRERLPLVELEADPEQQKHPEMLLHSEPRKSQPSGSPDQPKSVVLSKAVLPMAEPVVKDGQESIDPGMDLKLGHLDAQEEARTAEAPEVSPSASEADSENAGNPEKAEQSDRVDEIDPGFTLKF